MVRDLGNITIAQFSDDLIWSLDALGQLRLDALWMRFNWDHVRFVVFIWPTLEAAIFKEDVGGLEITMHDTQPVHRLKPFDSLNKNLPNQALFEVCANLFMVIYLCENVTVIRIFHHDTETVKSRDYLLQVVIIVIDKCFLVLYDILVANRRQYTDLIDGILFFLILEFRQINLL